MTRFTMFFAAGALVLGATAADARVALKDDKTIESGLVLVAAGKILRDTCDDITPRVLRAMSFARSLESRAKGLGYSRSEIDAYLKSDTDKARVKGKARAYLTSRGADMGQPATICAVGRDEIANGTSLGRLLRQK